MGDFVIVYWEARDIGKVFEGFMGSNDPFGKWFRDKILIEIHGMDLKNPPPVNEAIFDLKG